MAFLKDAKTRLGFVFPRAYWTCESIAPGYAQAEDGSIVKGVALAFRAYPSREARAAGCSPIPDVQPRVYTATGDAAAAILAGGWPAAYAHARATKDVLRAGVRRVATETLGQRQTVTYLDPAGAPVDEAEAFESFFAAAEDA